MDAFLIALSMGMLPAAGYVIGGLIAETFAISEKTLSMALHLAAGAMLAVVSVDLMPRVLEAKPAWAVIMAFVIGGVFFAAMDRGLRVISRVPGATQPTSAWAVLLGVAVELLNDGIMVGIGSTVNVGLGFILALGQLPGNVPEAFATVSLFREQGVGRGLRLLLSLAFVLPVLAGTVIGYMFLNGQPVILKYLILAFTAGVLTTLVVEEIVPLAHKDGEARLAALHFIMGFALLTFISAYVG
jgi:ZIP family zinc transporter